MRRSLLAKDGEVMEIVEVKKFRPCHRPNLGIDAFSKNGMKAEIRRCVLKEVLRIERG